MGWADAGPLEWARSDLRGYARDAGLYNSLIPFVQGLTRPSERVLAFPDCPEVTFLSGRPNPSPLMYEFLAPDPERQERLLKGLVREAEIRVVVFNHTIDFDPATQRRWLEELHARYPHQRRFTARDTVVCDRIFTVFWRP